MSALPVYDIGRVRPSHPGALLSQITDSITSLFGELTFIAGTWNEFTGSYEEPRLTAAFGKLEAAVILGRRHREVYLEWLVLRLMEQTAELKRYLDCAGNDRLQTLRSWMQNRSYERLVPKNVQPHERMLFISDMEIVLPLVYHEISGAVYDKRGRKFMDAAGRKDVSERMKMYWAGRRQRKNSG